MSTHLSKLRLFQRHLRSLGWVWVWVWDWVHTPLHTLLSFSPPSFHTIACLWDAMCTSHLKEQNSSIGWGGVGSRSVCIATGRLYGVTFCKSKSNNWSKVLITSGTNDAWVIPTSARMLFSQVRVKKQGHRSILDGPNPGLIIGDTGDFVPFVIEEETQQTRYVTRAGLLARCICRACASSSSTRAASLSSEIVCLSHLRDDGHNNGAVLQLPDSLAAVEHEVGQRLAGRPRVRVLNTASWSTKRCHKPVNAQRTLHHVFPAL
jgi:hypothetical protein